MIVRMASAAWAKYVATPDRPRPRPGRNKYHARRVVVDGIRFDSGREAARYRELAILLAAGLIHDLDVHPKFAIDVVELFRATPAGEPWAIVPVGTYTADFRYVETSSGELVVEDVKSGPTKTTAYRLRKRLVEAIHGIAIREV